MWLRCGWEVREDAQGSGGGAWGIFQEGMMWGVLRLDRGARAVLSRGLVGLVVSVEDCARAEQGQRGAWTWEHGLGRLLVRVSWKSRPGE